MKSLPILHLCGYAAAAAVVILSVVHQATRPSKVRHLTTAAQIHQSQLTGQSGSKATTGYGVNTKGKLSNSPSTKDNRPTTVPGH